MIARSHYGQQIRAQKDTLRCIVSPYNVPRRLKPAIKKKVVIAGLTRRAAQDEAPSKPNYRTTNRVNGKT